MVKLNKKQQVSLLRKWKQGDNGLTFIGFRRTVQSTFGMDGVPSYLQANALPYLVLIPF